MATRYADDYEFDHGAQFFTARTKAFQTFLQPLIDDGVVTDWQAQFAEFDRDRIAVLRSWDDAYPHYVGNPRMNSIGKALSHGLTVVLGTAITSIARLKNGWQLTDATGQESGPFDWLILTAPASQTAAIGASYPDLVAFCDERKMLGCYALMLGFLKPLDFAWQAALVRNSDVSWISVNSSKPGRKGLFTLVAHSTNAWADAHIDRDERAVLEHLFDSVASVTGNDLKSVGHRQLHRWRFANATTQAGPGLFLRDDIGLAACGDWCVRGRIEAAFTSANDLGNILVARI